MIRYVARRTLLVVPVLVGLSIAVFLMLRLIPGDVVDVILGSEGSASPERLAELRRMFGLDQSLPQQYLGWIASLLSGDFGRSIRTSRPILPDVLARVPVTYQLTVMAMVLSLLLAVPLGIVSSVKRSTSVDSLVRVVGLLRSELHPAVVEQIDGRAHPLRLIGVGDHQPIDARVERDARARRAQVARRIVRAD